MFEFFAMQLRKTHGTERPTYWLLYWNRATFNGTGNFCSRLRRKPLGGLGACSPRKFSNLKAFISHFQHSQADTCVKKVPKIDRYFFLNFDKKERCHQLHYIFIINNYYHTPLMLAKYDTSYLPRTKTYTVYFYLQFIYAPRVYSYLAGKKIGH